MNKKKDVKTLLKDILGTSITAPLTCTIQGVEDDTCTILLDDLELDDVRLKATIGQTGGLLLTPKVGSKALVISLTGTLDDLVLLRADSYSKIEFKENNLELVLDTATQKVKLKNQQVSLKDLFTSLHSIITNLKVNTAVGPSVGLLPDTITALTQLNTKINTLLD